MTPFLQLFHGAIDDLLMYMYVIAYWQLKMKVAWDFLTMADVEGSPAWQFIIEYVKKETHIQYWRRISKLSSFYTSGKSDHACLII